jgi:DNA replicative helicase MCM subunit Mcm2 (Cdc46/Mcm family)
VKGFDIVLQEPSDSYSDNQKLEQALTNSTNINTMPNGSPDHGLSADLRHHLMEAAGISSISISDSAYELIQSYYLALRCNREYIIDCDEDVGEYASLLTLHSLLRVAEACARLCLRNEIMKVHLHGQL